jgi:hypothetical protein
MKCLFKMVYLLINKSLLTNQKIEYFYTIQEAFDFILEEEKNSNNYYLEVDLDRFLKKDIQHIWIDGSEKRFIVSHINYPNEVVNYEKDNDGNYIYEDFELE